MSTQGACLHRGVSTAIKYHHILNIKHDEVKRQVGVVVGAANGFLLDPNLWMAGGGLEGGQNYIRSDLDSDSGDSAAN